MGSNYGSNVILQIMYTLEMPRKKEGEKRDHKVMKERVRSWIYSTYLWLKLNLISCSKFIYF
jgi:hypothetical protein